GRAAGGLQPNTRPPTHILVRRRRVASAPDRGPPRRGARAGPLAGPPRLVVVAVQPAVPAPRRPPAIDAGERRCLPTHRRSAVARRGADALQPPGSGPQLTRLASAGRDRGASARTTIALTSSPSPARRVDGWRGQGCGRGVGRVGEQL